MSARAFVLAGNNIRSCDRCGGCNGGTGAMAEKAGTEVKVAVVMGQWGIPGEKYLRAHIAQRFKKEEVAYVSGKGCVGGSTEPCRDHLERTLRSMDNLQLVLLVGGEGINLWRPDQTLAKQAGNVGALLGSWFTMPIPHPDSVIKGYDSRVLYGEWLDNARYLVDGELPWEMFKSDKCGVNRCSAEASQWDVDGVGYCEPKHWAKWGGQWKKVRKEWDRMKMEGTQVRLLV